jgi:hypothetical protein
MKFIEGELIEMYRSGQRLTFKILQGEDGEPKKHHYNTKTGKTHEYGSPISVTQKFKRLQK